MTRTVPVMVGVAQLRRRPKLDGPFEPIEPVQMMVDVVGRASTDAARQAMSLPWAAVVPAGGTPAPSDVMTCSVQSI